MFSKEKGVGRVYRCKVATALVLIVSRWQWAFLKLL
jgi:hypothetical protein